MCKKETIKYKVIETPKALLNKIEEKATLEHR